MNHYVINILRDKTGEPPKYLKERRENGEQKVIARARCAPPPPLQNGSKFWTSEEERKCQSCEDEEGTLEHWRDCREMEATNASLEEILSEEGGKEAVKWLRRKRKQKER